MTAHLITLNVDDPRIGCGERLFLMVQQGRRYVHLLYMPTLDHVRVGVTKVSSDERLQLSKAEGIAIARRLRQRQRDFESWGYRYSRVFIRSALKALRAGG